MGLSARLALSIATAPLLFTQSQTDLRTLELGRPDQRELAGNRPQEHVVRLQGGQYARLNIAQRTVNVAVTVSDPSGKELFAVDNHPIGEAEDVEWIAAAPGHYRLRVVASEAHAAAGRYEINLRGVEPATSAQETRIAAAREVARAAAMNKRGTRAGMLQAIQHFEAARVQWHAAEDPAEEARTLYATAFLYIELGDREKALANATEALPLARTSHDDQLLGRVLDCLGEVHNNFSDKKTAIRFYTEAMPLLQAAGDRAGEGRTLSNLGVAYTGSGERHKALELFRKAMETLRPLQDRASLATVAGNIGVTYDNLGEYQLSLENHQFALRLRRELGNDPDSALTLNNIGSAYSGLAEYQKALDAYYAALEINRSYDSRWNMAVNLNNIGWVYAMLGDRRRALSSYEESLKLSRAIQDRRRIAVALNNIANIHAELFEYRKAISLHQQALTLRRETNDPDGEATSLTNLGESYAKLGETEKAQDHLERALRILRVAANRHKLIRALRGLGTLRREAGDYGQSELYLEEALKISKDIRDQNGEASVLAEQARLQFRRGQLRQAHQLAEESVSVFDSLRSRVISPNLRATLVASARQVHELNIEILHSLHAAEPASGFDAAAFQSAERGRARSLLEILGESSVEIRQGVDISLLNRERELQRLIADKADRQMMLLNRKHSAEEAAVAARELDTLAMSLEQVQSKIRDTSPSFAALMRPATLRLPEIQSNVLDEDTVLLEYELAARKSYLWAVTRSSITSFELPPREEIESAVKRVYECITARNVLSSTEAPTDRANRVAGSDVGYYAAAKRVSQMLLAPVATQIRGKRLLIVAEGVLQYLPFSALPEPGKQAPLIVGHEVVIAPSASVLALLRRESEGRVAGGKSVFVLADPVYSTDDPRVAPTASAVAYQKSISGAPRQPGGEGEADRFLRLRFSRAEAERIARLIPANATRKALDFDASREAVLNADLTQFRILHFAAHGLLDDERPELSGIVLSLVDRTGQRQNGFLRLYDIYNLRLKAELVVLSACRTALGKDIKGEGLIGLTRGFFYAGAPRVLASLWPIDDRTGAAFMTPFYEAMLLRQERPAAALRSAQIAMWKTKGWEMPYYWAAFTIQGEWR